MDIKWIMTKIRASVSTSLIGRKRTNDEVTRAALFLAFDDSSYITGTTLVLGGGLLAHSGLPRLSELLK